MAVPTRCLHGSGPRALPAQAAVSWEVTGNPCQMPEVGAGRTRECGRSSAEPLGAAGLSPSTEGSAGGSHPGPRGRRRPDCPAQNQGRPLLSAAPRVPAPGLWLVTPSRLPASSPCLLLGFLGAPQGTAGVLRPWRARDKPALGPPPPAGCLPWDELKEQVQAPSFRESGARVRAPGTPS